MHTLRRLLSSLCGWWRETPPPVDLTARYFPSSSDGRCLVCHTRPIGMDLAERYCDDCLPPDERAAITAWARTVGDQKES